MGRQKILWCLKKNTHWEQINKTIPPLPSEENHSNSDCPFARERFSLIYITGVVSHSGVKPVFWLESLQKSERIKLIKTKQPNQQNRSASSSTESSWQVFIMGFILCVCLKLCTHNQSGKRFRKTDDMLYVHSELYLKKKCISVCTDDSAKMSFTIKWDCEWRTLHADWLKCYQFQLVPFLIVPLLHNLIFLAHSG